MKKILKILPLLVLCAALLIPMIAQAQEPEPPIPAAPTVLTVPGAGFFDSLVGLLTLPDMKRAGIVLFLVLGNWLCASLVAISQGRFDFHKAPEFITKTLLPFFFGFVIFQAALHVLSPSALADAFGKPISDSTALIFDAGTLWIAFGTILLSVGKSFVSNLSALLGVVVGGAQRLAAAATPAPKAAPKPPVPPTPAK